MSLNPDYMFRMAKLIQQERLEEAEATRRWLRLRRPAVEPTPIRPQTIAAEQEIERRQQAS